MKDKKKPEKAAKKQKSLFGSKNFLRLFSLLIAISMWLLVSFVVNPGLQRELYRPVCRDTRLSQNE